MKKIILLSFVILFTASCGDKNLKVTGDILDMPPQQFWLEEMAAKNFISLDSAMTDKDGHFTTTAPASEEPKMYRIRFAQGKYIMLVMSNEKAEVKAKWDNMDDYSVKGSAGSNTLKTFLGSLRAHIRDVNSLDYVTKNINAKASNKDSIMQQVQSDLKGMNTNFATYVKQFADTTKLLPNAVFAANILNPAVELKFLKKFYNDLPKRFNNSQASKDFKALFDEKFGNVVMPE